MIVNPSLYEIIRCDLIKVTLRWWLTAYFLILMR